jgi:hypothetical protein
MPHHDETGNPTGALPMRRPSRCATTSTLWRVALSPKLSSHATSMPGRWRSVGTFARNLTALGSRQFRRSRKIGFRIALRQSSAAVISAGFKFLARHSERCRQTASLGVNMTGGSLKPDLGTPKPHSAKSPTGLPKTFIFEMRGSRCSQSSEARQMIDGENDVTSAA